MQKPKRLIDVPSAWRGLEVVIEDLLDRFEIGGSSCLEFGVEFGYSLVVLSNFFETAIGVDTFQGDSNTTAHRDHYLETKQALSKFSNIQLERMDYQDWINQNEQHFDLVHVDIVHTYEDTFKCGSWAVKNSKCAIFHDTESFWGVRRAVIDLAKQSGKRLFNFPYNHGLGIIVE